MRAIAIPPQNEAATPSEAELLRRLRAGDESAFDIVVRRYQERIFRYVSRLVGDADEASDIAQETFIRAYGQIDRFRGESALYTWLYRIASNLSINALRKRGLRSFIGLDEAPSLVAAGGPEEDLRAAQIRERVAEAVDQLPPRQRSIFILRQYDQLSHREISKVVGSSEGAVRAGYFHAVKKLQKSLADLTATYDDGTDSHREQGS
ncbi:RNA polymerase sigma factor [Candidatus Latescibacterota bacterium]